MRAPWLALCCTLAAVNSVQAEPYYSRDRDDGFNPIDVVWEMPSPMKVFDSSDRRRSERRRIRPPFHRPPMPAYPRYAYPPSRPVPYNYYPNYPVQPMQNNAPRPGLPPPAHTPQPPTATPIIESAEQPVTAPDPAAQPTSSYAKETPPGYNFRPMTPMQQDVEEIAPPSATHESPTGPDTAPQSSITPPRTQNVSPESVLINGKPAVFRPMHLGAESPPE
ncbi:MAG: hypothetical protein ABFS39_00210 [Pseudomonadota bacterium]